MKELEKAGTFLVTWSTNEVSNKWLDIAKIRDKYCLSILRKKCINRLGGRINMIMRSAC